MPTITRTLSDTLRDCLTSPWTAQAAQDIKALINDIENNGIINVASSAKLMALVPLETEDPDAPDIAVIDAKNQKIRFLSSEAIDSISFISDPWISKNLQLALTAELLPKSRVADLISAIEGE